MSMAIETNQSTRESLLRRVLRAFVDIRELTLIVMIALIVIVMANLNPYFFSFSNFRALSVGMAPTAVIVIGMAILLASGGFDLSVGSVMALSSTVVAMLMLSGVPIPLAVACSLLLGAVAGLSNGLLVTGLGINPLIATLGTKITLPIGFLPTFAATMHNAASQEFSNTSGYGGRPRKIKQAIDRYVQTYK